MPKLLQVLRLVERVKCCQCSGRGYYQQRITLPNTYGRQCVAPASCPKCLRKGSVLVTKVDIVAKVGISIIGMVGVLLSCAAAVAGTGLVTFFAALFASLEIKGIYHHLVGKLEC